LLISVTIASRIASSVVSMAPERACRVSRFCSREKAALSIRASGTLRVAVKSVSISWTPG
jgi:hypothetical protein